MRTGTATVANSISAFAVAFAFSLMLGGTPARAYETSSSADISGAYVVMSSYSALDYYDCEEASLCEAYVEGQEYIDGAYGDWWASDDSDTWAEVDLTDNAIAGSTFTIEGFHYFYNIFTEQWENYGYDADSVTVPWPVQTPEDPVISGIWPGSDPAGYSGYIGIYGNYLSGPGDGNVSATLGGVPVSVTYVSDGQVNISYPASAVPAGGNYSVQVHTTWGFSNTATFTANGGDATPTISSVSPTSWSYNQSNPITISGSGFGTSPGVQLSYPDGYIEWASVTNANDTTIWATATHNSLVSGHIGVVAYSYGYYGTPFIPQYSGQPNYSSTYTGDSVTVPDPSPKITSVSPAVWTAGNFYPVTILGSGFGEAPSVTVLMPDGTSQTFSGAAIAATDNHVTATASFSISSPSGMPAANATVTLTSDGYLGNGFQAGAGGNGNVASAPIPVSAAPPPPAIQLTVGGTVVSQGSTVLISPAPAFPQLSANLVAAPGSSLAGTAAWQISFSYADKGTYNWQCSAPASGPRVLSATAAWNIGAEGTGICGGYATITCSYGSFAPITFTFKILGQNPAVMAVQTNLSNFSWFGTVGGTPWFLYQLVNHESGYKQFNNDGTPNWGGPNGFGVMQLDPPTSTFQIWDWGQNVTEGLTNHIKTTYSVTEWQKNVQAWADYNATQTVAGLPTTPPPNDDTESVCTFSMSPTGGNSHPFSDALWIKHYNGGAPFIAFSAPTPTLAGGWSILNFANTMYGPVYYVSAICASSQQ